MSEELLQQNTPLRAWRTAKADLRLDSIDPDDERVLMSIFFAGAAWAFHRVNVDAVKSQKELLARLERRKKRE